jgi:GxxExxY protein
MAVEIRNEEDSTAGGAVVWQGAQVPVENRVGDSIIASAMRVHTRLGPGLLESAYEVCLAHELTKVGRTVRRQQHIPIRYDGLTIENAYRVDLVVDDLVLVELKAVEAILPIHRAQLLGYLRLGEFKLGYLLNFNVSRMRDGIARMVNGL